MSGASPDIEDNSTLADRVFRGLQDDIVRGVWAPGSRLGEAELAAHYGVSRGPLREAIRRLESREVIQGYRAEVDYQNAGYPLRMLLFCTAPITERGNLIPEILHIDGVVSVQELVTGDQNLLVTAVGQSDSDITPVAQALLELGLTVADEVLVRSHETTPFGGFDSERRPDDTE